MRGAALLGLLLVVSGCNPSPAEPAACVDLTGTEIRARFADVIDRAEVQDGARGRARNHWCRDGRFTSVWETPGGRSGRLEGRWWVEGNLRCVSVDAGLPDDERLRRCSPIQRCGERIGTVNEAGERHGWHALEPAPCPTTDSTPHTGSLRERPRGERMSARTPLTSQGVPSTSQDTPSASRERRDGPA